MVGEVESRLPLFSLWWERSYLINYSPKSITTARTIVLLIARAQQPGHNFISFPAILQLGQVSFLNRISPTDKADLRVSFIFPDLPTKPGP